VTEETQASRPQPACPDIPGRYGHTDGTSRVNIHRSMPWDEEALNRERVPQRGVETILEDRGVVLEDIGFPRSLYFITERYTLRRRRTSAAPPIFAGRFRPFSWAAAEARAVGWARRLVTSHAWVSLAQSLRVPGGTGQMGRSWGEEWAVVHRARERRSRRVV
jgi:hypothetical protein